ncbi:MAG: DUF4272 domain-containing protein [Terriglobales bacterium]
MILCHGCLARRGFPIPRLSINLGCNLCLYRDKHRRPLREGEALGSTSEEALQRKLRSEAVLQRDGVRINQRLPVIEAGTDARLRSKQEIAYRALALLVVALKGEGLEQPLVEGLAKQYELAPYFTPKETAFIESAAPSQSDRTQFSWRYEAAVVLIWALGYLEDLGSPCTICDVGKAVTIMKERTTTQFVGDAKLRSIEQVLDEADLIYRYDWAIVDARLNNRPPHVGLEPGVVQERHYALNWLIGYMEQDWDDVSTDT